MLLVWTIKKDLIKNNQSDYEINLIDGENRLDSIVESIMNSLSNVLKIYPEITHVLVQGDTTSAFAVALSAFHHGLKIIHLEAGLRTYDNENPYPEEQNRRLISQIANIHLCPTVKNFDNLVDEKILGEKFVVGNTVLDNLISYLDKCEYTNKVLVTMHRRENHNIIDKWFIEINNLAKEFNNLEFIIPLHLNPYVQKYKHLLTDVKVINPMPYDELLNLLVKTRFVITDSGGLQEECSFFHKVCLVCRKITERPEAIGTSSYMVYSPDELRKKFLLGYYHYKIGYANCPFGNGDSAEKIYEILKNI